MGVVPHHGGDLTEARRRLHRSPGEGVGEVAEQPRPAEAAAAHDDAVAAGLGQHRQRVVRLPDVAVAEHRDAVTEALSAAMASQRAEPL